MGLGGIVRSIGGFLDLLSSIAERAEEEGGVVSRTGEIGGDGKGVKAVYGFSVRVGGAGQPMVEKFGNVKDGTRGPVVEEVREPMVDLFDEDDHVLVVAELPGVEAGDVRFEVKEDVLDLSAARGDRKYRKEVLLPAVVRPQEAASSYRNGVLEIKLPKTGRARQ